MDRMDVLRESLQFLIDNGASTTEEIARGTGLAESEIETVLADAVTVIRTSTGRWL